MGKEVKVDSTNTIKMISYLRNSVFVINALFTVIAACVFIIGTNVSGKYSSYEAFLSSYHTRAVQMLTVAGIISTGLALLGMLGAAKYNSRCLNVQNIFLVALLVIELAVICTGAFILTDIKTPIETKMLQTIPKVETHEKIRKTWNFVQEDSRCCGVNSHEDWTRSISTRNNNGSTLIPYSCCSSYNCNNGNLFQDGCVEHVVDYVLKSMQVITFVPIAVMILQIILFILSCLLLKYIRLNKLLPKDLQEYRTSRPETVSFFISSTSILDRSRI